MKIPVSIGLITVTSLVAFTASGADWYRWRGPDLNGISKETGWQTSWPADGPKQLWKASIGIGYASFSVANGRAYTTGTANDTDTVFCFDAATGKELWKHSYPSLLFALYNEGGTSATPTVDGDRVYQFGKWGDLFCFEAASGAVVWSTNVAKQFGLPPPKWGFASSPLIEGDMLILNAGTAGLALDKKNGKLLWKTGTEPAGYATPQPYGAGDSRGLLVFGSNVLHAVALKDGRALWEYPWNVEAGINVAQPIIDGDRVFLSTGYNVGGAVLKVADNKPQVVWQSRNMRSQINTCILWKGFLYGPDEAQLRCLAFDTGDVKWTERSVGKGSLMMADEKLIVLSDKGELMVAEPSPEGFKPMARAQVLTGKCWTMPVLSNGRIYCRNISGNAVCLDVSGK